MVLICQKCQKKMQIYKRLYFYSLHKAVFICFLFRVKWTDSQTYEILLGPDQNKILFRGSQSYNSNKSVHLAQN